MGFVLWHGKTENKARGVTLAISSGCFDVQRLSYLILVAQINGNLHDA